MYKTYSYSDMPVPVSRRREDKAGAENNAPKKNDRADIEPPPPKQPEKSGSFLQNLETDDIILIAVALVLLMDGCDDKILLIALAVIFMADKL